MYCIESLLLSLTKLIGRLAKHHIQFFFSHKKILRLQDCMFLKGIIYYSSVASFFFPKKNLAIMGAVVITTITKMIISKCFFKSIPN